MYQWDDSIIANDEVHVSQSVMTSCVISIYRKIVLILFLTVGYLSRAKMNSWSRKEHIDEHLLNGIISLGFYKTIKPTFLQGRQIFVQSLKEIQISDFGVEEVDRMIYISFVLFDQVKALTV